MPERLMGITEAAELLGVHIETVRRWADKGLIPVVRLPSGHRRFRRADLVAAQAKMEGRE